MYSWDYRLTCGKVKALSYPEKLKLNIPITDKERKEYFSLMEILDKKNRRKKNERYN